LDEHDFIIEKVAKPWYQHTFWLVFFLSFIVSTVFVVLVNWIVDPFDLYGNDYLPPWQQNRYTEKYDLYRAFDPPPEALIIGSSRVGSIDPEAIEQYTGYRTFHWGVPSAGVEAFNAILSLALERDDVDLNLIVIGVDPVSFEAGNPIQKQMLHEPHYTKYFDITLKQELDGVIRLITKEQTVNSLKVIFRSMGGEVMNTAQDHRADGMPLYSSREELIAEGKFDLQSNLDLRLAMYPDQFSCITGSSVISEHNKRLWEEFLSKCTEHGIKVAAFTPTMHPRLYDRMEYLGAFPKYEEISSYLKETVEGSGGIYMDFTDLSSFGGDPDEFYDEVHMRRTNGNQMLSRLFADYDDVASLADSVVENRGGVSNQ
jgi:hypothetical protein